MFWPVALLALVWLILLALVCGAGAADVYTRERTFVGASLFAATVALVAVAAVAALHAGGIL